ncbi:MAG: hypothetical protein R6V55_06595 [Desulfovermiculus sp.]
MIPERLPAPEQVEVVPDRDLKRSIFGALACAALVWFVMTRGNPQEA